MATVNLPFLSLTYFRVVLKIKYTSERQGRLLYYCYKYKYTAYLKVTKKRNHIKMIKSENITLNVAQKEREREGQKKEEKQYAPKVPIRSC